MKSFYRTLRVLSAVNLFFFCWANFPVWDMAVYAAQNKLPSAATRPDNRNPVAQDPPVPNPSDRVSPAQTIPDGNSNSRFENLLNRIEERIASAERRNEQGQNAAMDLGVLKIKHAELKVLGREYSEQLARAEKKLMESGLGNEILDRHRRFVKRFNGQLHELSDNLESVEKEARKDSKPSAKALANVKRQIDRIKTPKKHFSPDLDKLSRKTAQRAPRLKKEEFEKDLAGKNVRKAGLMRDFPQAGTALAGVRRKPLLLAFNAVASDMPSTLAAVNTDPGSYTQYTPFQTAQADTDDPVAADLAETADVQFSQPVKDLAAQLEGNPVKLYEWVRNNVEFVPGYGSLQGADMCLQTRQCNDFDTASLLISLFRASNIPARYAFGTIDLSAERFKNWAGGFSDSNAAIGTFVSAGIPIAPIVTGGSITGVRIEHVWVDAWIDYNPSRGARHREGDTWIPLDGSFKQYTSHQGVNIAGQVPLDSQSFINQIQATALVNEQESHATGVNCGALRQSLADYQTRASSFLDDHYSEATVRDILGYRTIVKHEFPYLLGTLPYLVTVNGGTVSELPDQYRHKITLRLSGSADTVEITRNLAELAGKSVSFDYTPATQADEDAIKALLPRMEPGETIDPALLPSSFPAYLIMVKPRIKISGVVIATGQATGLGQAQALDVSFTDAATSVDSYSRKFSAGEYLSLAINTGNSSKGLLRALKTRLEAAKGNLQAGTALSKDDVLGNLLYGAALSYLAEGDAKDQVQAATRGLIVLPRPSLAAAGARLETAFLFGAPYTVQTNGVTVDAIGNGNRSRSLKGSNEEQARFNFNSAIDSLALSHLVLQELYGTDTDNVNGISLVTVLQAAKDSGIPLYTLNQGNIAVALPNLQVSDEIKTDIGNAVQAGNIVVAPKTPVTIGDRRIEAYLVVNPDTGAAVAVTDSDINGALAFPQWTSHALSLMLATENTVAWQTGLAGSMISDSFVAAAGNVINGTEELLSGKPSAYTPLLTNGYFNQIVDSELTCYVNAVLGAGPAAPTASCMSAFLGTVCIASGSASISTGNTRPKATIAAAAAATIGKMVILDGSGSADAEHDALTFAWSLLAKPDNSTASLNSPGAAVASFVPDYPGEYKIELIVHDGKAFSDPAVVTVIASRNLVAVPEVVGKTQQEAEAALINAGIRLGAISSGNSDTITSGSIVSQMPAGAAMVTKGSFVDLTVSAGPAKDTEAPVLTVDFDKTPSSYIAGDTATLFIEASDNSGTVAVTLTVDGTVMTATQPETTISTTGFAPGSVHTVEVTAIDAFQNKTVKSLLLGIKDPSNTTPPSIAFTSPLDEAEIAAPTVIVGTVETPNLLNYTLSYSPRGKSNFTEFATGTAPITNGALGTLDPTLMKNGLYDVRLTATDTNGKSLLTEIVYRVRGDMKVGNFTVTFTDLNIPVSGLPIVVNRTYDSRDKTSGDFGIGWSVDIQNTKLEENRIPGEGWPEKSSGGMTPTYCINGDSEHYVSVALPDGRTEEFDMKLTPDCQLLAPIDQTTPGFVARPGTTSKLAIKNAKALLVVNGELIDPDTTKAYDPSGYLLTTTDGTVYDLDQNYGLRKVTDTNGNTLTYASNGITHSAAKGVVFTRDDKGRITKITAPDDSTIIYTYDTDGNLASMTDQAGNTTRYSYNRSHGLTDIKDPKGITPVKNEYDSSGRLMAHIDSQGNRIDYTHDVAGRQEVVKDRLGNLTVYIYDEKGRVLQKTDPEGNKTAYIYDSFDNKTSETDPLGNTTRWTYDGKKNVLTEAKVISRQTFTTSHTYNSLGKVLTTTDALGLVITNTYDPKGNLLTTVDALCNTTTNTYYADGNLKTTEDALGNITTYEYDAYGNRTKQTTASGAVTAYTYDGKGNKLTETDPRGYTTSYTYDANGKLLTVTNAAGNTATYEYDKSGNKVAEVNALGAWTFYYYDSANRLAVTEYPDGTTTKAGYDAEGNRVASIDQLGRVTTNEYNSNKQLVKTIYADGTSRGFGYDKAGRQTTVADAYGNTTTKEYDVLGRMAKSIDPEGHTTSFEYDANGNQVKQVDANNHATTYVYDANNRMTDTILPGGQRTIVGYDELGRKTFETDAAGIKTQFDYDSSGNLVKVTDAMGGQTKYEYDLNNNRTAIQDARGNRTIFDFDNLNRLISKTMPNGGTETYAYDAAGRQIAKTDAKSQKIEYAYDSTGRLTDRIYPDGTTVVFSYTSTGKRETVKDKRGTTSYRYDDRGRMTKNTYPDGKAIDYTYDKNGRISTLSSFASTVTYSYSSSGRLKDVTDPQGSVTNYSYDDAGNRTGLAYPNGTAVSYVYDNNNRLTQLTHKNSVDEILASYAYTLGAIGNRTRIDESNGISRKYDYDHLYRLTKEQVTDPSNAQTYQNDYSYDAVGNRLNKTSIADSKPSVSNDYAYNNADQLLTENGITYAYDLNGHLASKTDANGTTTYEYDFDDRLVKVTASSGTAAYQYDADGNRVGATTATGTVKYLIDTNRGLTQVLAEYGSTGTLAAFYVYADDLININRSGNASYYHFDGLGSTRLLSDDNGIVTDTYHYDAFGNLIARTGMTENQFLFTGQQYDANIGFYYLRARYYQPETGRFSTLDPYHGDPYAPASLHKYVYAANDPLNKVDPNGEEWNLQAAITYAVTLGILMQNQVASFVTKFGQRLNICHGLEEHMMKIVEKVATEFTALGPEVNMYVNISINRALNITNTAIGRLRPDIIVQVEEKVLKIYEVLGKSQKTGAPNLALYEKIDMIEAELIQLGYKVEVVVVDVIYPKK